MKKYIAVLALGVLALLTTSCDKLRSRDHMNKGVQAYRNARWPEAVEHFKAAVQLDPQNVNGKLYLATAYMTQYVPGVDDPRNQQFASAARDEFNNVLKDNPNDRTALASLASLCYQEAQGIPKFEDKVKKLDESKDWNLKLIQADPQAKEAFYTLAVIDWLKWYPNYMSARAEMGMKPEDPGPLKDKKVKEELKEKYGPLLQDGIDNLNKALAIDKNYDDAMSYMNLLIRQRADLLDTKEEYNQQIDVANNWVQKSLDTKKAKAALAAKQPGGGVTP
jgi:tetratricopeptide (TPR) repeat protein